jgi:hypothetical protein
MLHELGTDFGWYLVWPPVLESQRSKLCGVSTRDAARTADAVLSSVSTAVTGSLAIVHAAADARTYQGGSNFIPKGVLTRVPSGRLIRLGPYILLWHVRLCASPGTYHNLHDAVGHRNPLMSRSQQGSFI